MATLPTNRIRYVGPVDIELLVGKTIGWFSANGYDAAETQHKYKIGGEGIDFEIMIEATKHPTERIEFFCRVILKVQSSQEVEITKGDRVVRTYHGRTSITISPKITEDWQEKFGVKGSFAEKISKFVSGHITDYQLRIYWDKLETEMRTGVERTIREALNMETVEQNG